MTCLLHWTRWQPRFQGRERVMGPRLSLLLVVLFKVAQDPCSLINSFAKFLEEVLSVAGQIHWKGMAQSRHKASLRLSSFILQLNLTVYNLSRACSERDFLFDFFTSYKSHIFIWIDKVNNFKLTQDYSHSYSRNRCFNMSYHSTIKESYWNEERFVYLCKNWKRENTLFWFFSSLFFLFFED